MKAFRAGLEISYNGKNITHDLKDEVLSFSYTDNDGSSEELQLTLKNKERLWESSWFPKRGDTIDAKILLFGEETKKLPCGIFEVDSLELKGLPNTATIKALSTAVSGEIKDTKVSRAWEKIKYKKIVEDIAAKHGMTAIFHIKEDKFYDKIDQNNKSDIEFLKEITENQAFSIKLESKKIVITDDKYYEEQEAAYDITYIDKKRQIVQSDKEFYYLTDWNFKETSVGAYVACENQYKSTKTGDVIRTRVENPNSEGTKKILRLNKKVKDETESKELCEKALRKEGAKTKTASFSFHTREPIAAKSLINVQGWGKFDGKYLIDSVSHNLSASGYTVELECRKFYVGMSLTETTENGVETGTAGGVGASNSKIEKMISHAESMLGMKYSQPMRMSKNYADCSSTVARSMSAAGLAPPGAAWSTETIPTCGYFQKINMNELRRGDILNYRRNGKGHAMIYIGNGKVIEAQPKRGVSYGKLRTAGYTAYRIIER